jgi:hypothetical protein
MTSRERRSFTMSSRFMLPVLAAVLAACGSTEPKVDLVPATITATATDTIHALAGAAVPAPLTVTVKNKAGVAVDSALVTFTVTAGGGSLSASSVRTNSSGVASTTWTLGPTVGVQSVSASVGALSPISFTALATVGAAKNIVKNSVDSQSVVVGATVPANPSVKVTDQGGNPVSGVLVTFAVTQGNGIVLGGAVNTNANGIATVAGWSLGQIVGTNSLSASVAGIATPVTFTATGLAGPAATVTVTPASLGQLTVGQKVSVTAKASDAFGNALPASSIVLTSSNNAVASVDATGLVTALAAGNASIVATAGAVSGNATLQVIGHPAGFAISSTLPEGAFLTDVAFTTNATLVSLASTDQVQILDASATTQQSLVTTHRFGQFLVAPSQGTGPALQIEAGTTSRVNFIDPSSGTVIDSLDIIEQVVQAAMNSSGTKAFCLLSDGELATIDVATRTQSRFPLGGGTHFMRLDHGDSLLYVSTTVGVMFEVDVLAGHIKRQIILSAPFSDYDVSRDGRFLYLLDAPNSLVRIYDIVAGAVATVLAVEANPTSISISPDAQQIWLTHGGTAPKISVYGRNAAGSFLPVADIPTVAFNAPVRIYFSPSGAFAAVPNMGGWVDIIR